MGQHYMRQKLKAVFSFLIILILLPYIAAVFINGGDMKAEGKNNSAFVKVKKKKSDGEEQIVKVSWEEYFIGMLANEIPESYEEEALKAQAVLIRTTLYQTLDNSEDKILEDSYLEAKDLEKKWGSKNYDKNYKKLKKAMDDTKNQVLYYNDA